MKKIIITLGDPCGIGPETTFKALKKIKSATAEFTLIGDIENFKKFGPLNGDIKHIDIKSPFRAPKEAKPSKRGGDVSFKALKKAVDLMLAKQADALVTAPISKEAWQKAGVKYMGHTEFLREKAAKQGALMTFKSGRLLCALITEHYALKDLSKALNKKRIKDAARILANIAGRNTPIEVSALNPHCGDGGKIGKEEIETIMPAVKELKKEGLNISGPYPIDTIWLRHKKGLSGAVLITYHDAALLGLKLAAKEPVIHITAGLKFLRVSPTHGTAFDIAGKNKADESSMLAAIKYALSK